MLPRRSCRLPSRLLPFAALSLVALLGACAMPPGDGPFGRTGTTIGRGAPGDESPTPSGPLPTDRELAADPNRLKGFAAGQVVAALGDPNYRRREAPAEVWQYYGPGCVLDLFLYDEKGAQRVAYVEVRNQSAGQSGASACISQLLGGRRGQQSS